MRISTLILVVTMLASWAPSIEASQVPLEGDQQNQPSEKDADDAEEPEEVIVVTASRREEQLINAPATMTVVSEEAIGLAPSQSLTDLLRSFPGINTVQASARDVNITSRGATGTLEDSMLVLLDGRSIYQDFFGFVMWDFLPVDAGEIKQIELIRGPASAVWGANALNGVVNVITRTPREMKGSSLSIRFGHFDRTRRKESFDGGGLFSINAVHAEAPSDRFAFKISAGLLAQESFLRPIGNVPGKDTPYPTFANRGTTQPRLDARADYDFTDKRQKIILAGGITGTEGIMHTGLGPIEIQRGSTFKYGRITYYRDRLKAQLFVNALDGEGVMLLQRTPDNRPHEPTFENQAFDVEISNANLLGKHHLLSYGGNYRHNQFDVSLAPRGNSRDEGGAYLQDTIVLSDQYQWIVGARIDRFGVLDRVVFSPRTTFLVKPRRNHALRLSYNRAFRAPSFFNSFVDTAFVSEIDLDGVGAYKFPTRFVGNPDLAEEQLTAYEAAYVGWLGPLTLEAAVYANYTRNMILFTTTASYTSASPPPQWPLPAAILDILNATGRGLPSELSYQNFNQVTDRGVEVSLGARINPFLATSINYTWQADSKPKGFSASEINVPPTHLANCGVSFDRGRYFGSATASFQDAAFWQDVLDARYHGWTSPFTLVNVGAGVRSTDRTMTVAVRVANLLNTTTQQHIFGDLIKRMVTGEVRFTF